jgi:hypothetical protein
MATGANWQYALIALCKDELILIGDKPMTKQEVAIITVVLDLVICFVFWLGLLAMTPLQEAVDAEINLVQVDPNDFTVVIKQVPYLDRYEELRPIYWAWAENILEQEDSRDTDPNGNVDSFQNYVLNVNFGLGNYGHLIYYEEMGHLLTQKKHLEKEIKKWEEQRQS